MLLSSLTLYTYTSNQNSMHVDGAESYSYSVLNPNASTLYYNYFSDAVNNVKANGTIKVHKFHYILV